MERKYAYDVLPSGNLFSELVDFTDMGYFDEQSQDESRQQARHEMTTHVREEPREFGEFRQEELDEISDSPLTEPPERGDLLQMEPGECGDSSQKPPACDDLPQEETWAQPPSPPASALSLTPTYTTLTMMCVPLSDSNEPTVMSAGETVITPQIAGISPQITNKSPQCTITAVLPQTISIPPQMISISPQITSISPQMTTISPQMPTISPQMISISPQMISILPQVTSISPQMTTISPKMTRILPKITGTSPQKISSPVPVPHVTPRKSFAIDRKNEYHCDFPSCNKVYTMSKFLNYHMKTHTKPYLCTAKGCKWRFARLACFNRHMRTKHTASKPFRCRYCDKCFTRSDNLATHETVRCAVRRMQQHKNK